MTKPSKLIEAFEFEEAKGEIRAYGRRFTMVDLVGLCRHMDSLAGEKIAGVIVANHGRQTGNDDVNSVRKNHPEATPAQLMDALRIGGILGGHGIAMLATSEDDATPISLEIENPIAQSSSGTCVKLILSYWEGALGAILGKTLDITDVVYEPAKNTLKCRLTIVGIPESK